MTPQPEQRPGQRPDRTVPPVDDEPTLVVSLPPAPTEGRAHNGISVIVLLAVLTVLGVAAGLAVVRPGPLAVVPPVPGLAAAGVIVALVLVGVAALVHLVRWIRSVRRRRARWRSYHAYIRELREELEHHERSLQERSSRSDPAVAQLPDIASDPARLWERRRDDRDFLRLRVGTGELAARRLILNEGGTVGSPTDPYLQAEARALVERFGRTPGLPLRLDLDGVGEIGVVGPDGAAVAQVARAAIAQLVTLHSPDDVVLAVIAPPMAESEWAWVRLLPHAVDPTRAGPDGPLTRLVTDDALLEPLLGAEIAERTRLAAAERYRGPGPGAARRPRLVVIDDARDRRPPVLPDAAIGYAALGVTVVHLLTDRSQEPREVICRVTVDGDALTFEDLAATPPSAVHGTVDDAPLALIEALAHTLAPLRPVIGPAAGGPGATVSAVRDPDATDPAFDPVPARPAVPAAAVELAVLLGAAEPTALDVGRLWAPRSVRDVLRVPVGVDPAGRPTMLDLKPSADGGTGPHGLVAGTTAAGRVELLRTLLLALAALHPPEQLSLLLVDGGGGTVFAPLTGLPHVAGSIPDLSADAVLADRLFSTLDGEVRRRQLLTAGAGAGTPAPGRLLVAVDEFGDLLTTRPEFTELFDRLGRFGGSIGIHLLLSGERIERGQLGELEGHLSYRIGLQPLSGSGPRAVTGYLKIGVGVYEMFTAAAMSRPLSLMVDRLAAASGPVTPIWLPPLPPAVTLGRVGGGIDVTPRGLRLRGAGTDPGALAVPLGLLDDPARQWQGPWLLNLGAGGGHLLVLGQAGAGKSTVLHSLALAVATTREPDDVGIYGVDLHGSSLGDLVGLPHARSIAGRSDTEGIRRTVEEVHALLALREQAFARLGIGTVAELLAHRRAGDCPELACAEVVFLLDGYRRLAGVFGVIESMVHDLVARGGRVGLHVVATAQRADEVGAVQRAAFAQRVELRLADPAGSAIDAALAARLPLGVPGRALTSSRLVVQVALPRLDPTTDRPVGPAPAVALVRAAWPDPARRENAPGGVHVGRYEDDLSPAVLDLGGRDQHVLVLGDHRSGKTNLLRLVVDGLLGRFRAGELVFAVVDPRRGLTGVVPREYLGAHATDAQGAHQLAEAVAARLADRRSGRPRIVLLIDDHDLLPDTGVRPFAALVPYLAAGRDNGLQVIMTHQVRGASRGLYDAFTLVVRESACAGVILSGDPAEGPLLHGAGTTTLPVGRGTLVRAGEPPRPVQTFPLPSLAIRPRPSDLMERL